MFGSSKYSTNQTESGCTRNSDIKNRQEKLTYLKDKIIVHLEKDEILIMEKK